VLAEFISPDDRPTDSEAVQGVLRRVGIDLPIEVVGTWTFYELVLAYDWAARVHMIAAGKPPDEARRAKPSFIACAEAR
jgi:hypothetical protein